MNCQNPKCRATGSRVTKSFGDAAVVKRWRTCPACGARWTTDERPNANSLVIPGGHNKPPPRRLLPPMATNGQGNEGSDLDLGKSDQTGGGKGGGFPSSSDPDPDRKSSRSLSDPDPSLDRGQGIDRARGSAGPARYRSNGFNHLATNIPAFLRVYGRYPNKVGKNVASQIFRELAVAYPGGEDALSAAITGAFDRGMLQRRPYHDEKEGVRFCPALERFLERRLWEDEIEDAPAVPGGGKKLPEYG